MRLVCGIVGYLNLNGSPLNPYETTLASMCESILHRGPDEQGMTVKGPIALGMTRLSIIDLATGQQPIPNEDQSVWIVFNGEIYNYQALQDKVRAAGHKLATNSDTEVIVHLYEDYGIDCLQFLEGMFSFAIWDIPKQRLFIARDRMGEKPLHWGIFDGKLIFGSEIKGILAHPCAKRELDTHALRKYLALEYVPAPDTIFRGIHKLKPAHFMVVENGNLNVRNYWHPRIESVPMDENEAEQRFISLLEQSIKTRLISDVPLGIFLSGGIDSSGITAVAARVASKQLKTFSIGFSDPSYDESAHAQLVADHVGTDHTSVEFSPNMAYSTMEELWNYIDEPLADASILPTFFLSKMTKRSVTVALSGDGGDELFGGYPTYQAHQYAEMWNKIPAVMRKKFFNPLINRLPVSLNNLSFDFKAKRFISAADAAPLARHLRWMGAIPLSEHHKLLRPEIMDATICDGGDPGSVYNSTEQEFFGSFNYFDSPSGNADVAEAMMRLDLASYLPEDLLVKSDRASMAASLEVRIPFLAYPIVEFALALPSSLKLRGRTTKYLPKKAFASMLPESVLRRPKKGFGIPVAKWINADFRPLVNELLDETFLQRQGIFNPQYVCELVRQHTDGVADRRKELWTLLMFQRWYQSVLLPSHTARVPLQNAGALR